MIEKRIYPQITEEMPELRILFFLLGSRSKASSRVRGFWVAEELTSLGAKCAVVYGEDRASYLRCLGRLQWYDIVYIQKRCSRWDYYLMNFASLMGKRTIFDIDDAYSRVKSKKTLRNISRIMKRASAVTVGSKNLLEFARQYQENSYLVPSSITLKYYEPSERQRSHSHVCLGWIGNGAHYYRDLIEILQEPLREVAAQQKVRLKLVGVCKQRELYQTFSNIPELETTFIDGIDWSDESEVCKAIQDFDIGLYPIIKNDNNYYKCGFKALEYMAMGIPVVASPVGANSYIISEGIDGYLSNGKKEWVDALSLLITNLEARKKMGQAGRLKVEKQYNISESAKELARIMSVVICERDR